MRNNPELEKYLLPLASVVAALCRLGSRLKAPRQALASPSDPMLRVVSSGDGRNFSRGHRKTRYLSEKAVATVERYSLPPLGLQRNRKTPEPMTIGKPLYFCSGEFVGQFLRISSATPLPATGCSSRANGLCPDDLDGGAQRRQDRGRQDEGRQVRGRAR
jgi:hypothetical protein